MKVEFVLEVMHTVGSFYLVVDGRRELIRATLDPIKDMDLILERTQSSLDAIGSDIPICYNCPWWGKSPQIPKSRMPKEAAPTPTIAELWGELRMLLKQTRKNAKFLETPTDGDYCPYREAAAKDITWAQDKIKSLRSVLLERCEKDQHITIREIWEPNESRSLKITCRGNYSMMTIQQASEFGAAMAFMAWELAQRQKETLKQD